MAREKKTASPPQQVSRAVNRLKRVEGQIRGLRRMLEQGKTCQDILVQYAAAHAALTRVGHVIVNEAMADCLVTSLAKKKTEREALAETMKVFLKYAEHLT